MMSKKMNLQNNSTGKTIVGILLIVFGATLFLSNFNIINGAREIIFSWQIIFLVIGLILFINHKDSGTGLIFLMIGAIGLIAKLNHTSMKFIFKEYWPALLIIFGIYILLSKNDCQFSKHKKSFGENKTNINSDNF